MGVIVGYESTNKDPRSEVQPVTANRVSGGRQALDVIAHFYAAEISGDTAEAGSTNTVIQATGHSALVGDLIRFDSGPLDYQEFSVLEVTTDTITLASEAPSAPDTGDMFTVLRYGTPVFQVGGVVPTIETQYTTLIDDVGAGVLYVGKAAPGTATGDALWRIIRITESGDDLTVEWADGDSLFNNEWDNRAALSYST